MHLTNKQKLLSSQNIYTKKCYVAKYVSTALRETCGPDCAHWIADILLKKWRHKTPSFFHQHKLKNLDIFSRQLPKEMSLTNV